jgi:hypothetical protein
MLAADTIDALVAPTIDETPACVWTPADAEVAVSSVDTPVTDPVAVPSIATDPVPLMYSVLDTGTVLPIFVADPTGNSDGTGLLTGGATQGTDDSSVDSGVSDVSVDGSGVGADFGNGLATDPPIGDPVAVVDPIDTCVFPIPVDPTVGTNWPTGDATDGSTDANAVAPIDVRVQFVSSDVGWAAYYYSVSGDGTLAGVSVFASYDEPKIAAFVAEHADDASVQITDCGDGWWISGFPPELAPPVPVGDQSFIDPTTGTDLMTGDATVGTADGSAAGSTDSGNGLATDPTVDTTQGTDGPSADTSSNDGTQIGVTDAGVGQGLVFDQVIPVDRPVWEMRDLAGVPMVEDFVGLSVAQPAVESPAVDFSTSPVVAFAGSDQTAAAISPENRAAAFSMVPVTAQPSVASMYAAFAAGFSQSAGDGQGSSAFAGVKRSARR